MKILSTAQILKEISGGHCGDCESINFEDKIKDKVLETKNRIDQSFRDLDRIDVPVATCAFDCTPQVLNNGTILQMHCHTAV